MIDDPTPSDTTAPHDGDRIQAGGAAGGEGAASGDGSARPIVAVLGGTGMLGRPLVRALQDDGFTPRVITRSPDRARTLFSPDVELRGGDVRDDDRLRHMLDGCAVVHISLPGVVELAAAEAVARVAPALGIERLGYISGASVLDASRDFPMAATKARAEQALRDSGVPCTILAPTMCMGTLPMFVRGGRATILGKQPELWHWFDAADLARMTSAAFRLPAAADKRLTVHGPEGIAMKDALERYVAAVHPDVDGVSVTPLWIPRLMATVTRNDNLKQVIGLFRYFAEVGEGGDPAEADALLGAPRTTLDQWIQRQAAKAAERPASPPTATQSDA